MLKHIFATLARHVTAVAMDSSRLARKRLKPAVSLAAVHRKPKDENQPPKADGNEQGKASNGSETSSRVVQLNDVKCCAEGEPAAEAETLPQDSVLTNCIKPGPRVAPFRSRFIRPKPRLDLVQRSANKQPAELLEEERTKNLKAVGADHCKSVATEAPNIFQDVAIGESVNDVRNLHTFPQNGRPDSSRFVYRKYPRT